MSTLPYLQQLHSTNSKAVRILVIDEEPSTINVLNSVLNDRAPVIRSVRNPKDCNFAVDTFRPHLVFLDRRTASTEMDRILRHIVAQRPGIDVVLTDQDYSADQAVEVIQRGVFGCWPKPLKPAIVRRKLTSWFEESSERRGPDDAGAEAEDLFRREGMIGRSQAMVEVYSRLRRIAPHYRTALLTGETGTGKDVAARMLHRLSPVANRPLVVCNCAAIVDTLFESELFGYVKGAFTGALQNKPGLFDQADGGTIFLDEVGELTPGQQCKLLRVLQNSEIRPVGGTTAHRVDVHVIAATNRNLPQMVAEKRFREDLYFRLAMVQLRMPTLAERRDDLLLLARHFLRIFEALHNKEHLVLSRAAEAFVMHYPWPGNIRELENVLGYCSMMTEDGLIDLPHFPSEMMRHASSLAAYDESMIPVDELVRRHAARVLQRVNGNRSRAAEILGISRATIYRLLRETPPEPSSSF